MTPSQPKSGEMSDSKAGLSEGRSSSEDLPPAPAKSTPGPWTWGDDYRGLYGSGQDNEVLTYASYEGMWVSYGDKRDANAALIAAAPDLLAAAKCAANVLFLLQDEVKALGCNAKNVPDQLRAAIALATKE